MKKQKMIKKLEEIKEKVDWDSDDELTDDDDLTCDAVDDYTIGFATYLMQKNSEKTDKLNAEIKRLKKENAYLLKACEEKFTFNTTQNKKYSVFNTVRKELVDRIKVLIFQKGNPYDVPFEEFVKANVFCGYLDELLKEYEK